MTPSPTMRCTAFAGTRRIASGPLIDVAMAVKIAAETATTPEPILTFDDDTGRMVDLDLRGSVSDIAARWAVPPTPAQSDIAPAGTDAARPAQSDIAPAGTDAARPARGRGRPKLGVVAREVTLLPRHWEWLSAQRGGASQALRRLVEAARKADCTEHRKRAAQEAAYHFMVSLAGDLPGFEEAARSLFAGDGERFAQQSAGWPDDVRDHAWRLAEFDHAGVAPAQDR